RGFRVKRRSAIAVVLGGQARTPPGLDDAAGEDHPDRALALTRPRGEEGDHPLVVRPAAGEGVADLVREVVVADADGVRIAERADPRLGRGPGADPGKARE